MFPLPGAPRQQAMDPTKLQAFMKEPGGAVNSASLKPTNSRQAKRLIVSNLPASATEESVLAFFNLQLNGLNVIESTDPCSLAQLSADHTFALLEFKTPADATVALALDGQSMEADDAPTDSATNGSGTASGLQIRRPKDYIVPAVVDDPNYEPGRVSNVVIDTPSKISVTNIPPYLSSEQVLELLNSFGELKAFVLVQDRGTEESRGIAFCEYLDPAATDVAINGLDNMELGDKHLKVRKASIGITQVAGVEMGVNAMSMLAGTTSTDSEVTRVLQLLNMVTPEELMDPDDYEGKKHTRGLIQSMTEQELILVQQKSARMLRMSAASSVRSWISRFLDPVVAVSSRRAWARSTSSTIPLSRPPRHSRPLPVGNSRTGRWSPLISQRYVTNPCFPRPCLITSCRRILRSVRGKRITACLIQILAGIVTLRMEDPGWHSPGHYSRGFLRRMRISKSPSNEEGTRSVGEMMAERSRHFDQPNPTHRKAIIF